MREMKRYQITEWCHHFMENHVKEGDLCIDATAGNGNDTLFLCELVGECGRVLAFDIQKEAVENTKKRILEHQMEKRADVFLESHTKMQKYAKEETVDCIVFNFGYLPGGDRVQPVPGFHQCPEHLHRLRGSGQGIAQPGQLAQGIGPQVRRPPGGHGGPVVVHQAGGVVVGEHQLFVRGELLQRLGNGHMSFLL